MLRSWSWRLLKAANLCCVFTQLPQAARSLRARQHCCCCCMLSCFGLRVCTAASGYRAVMCGRAVLHRMSVLRAHAAASGCRAGLLLQAAELCSALSEIRVRAAIGMADFYFFSGLQSCAVLLPQVAGLCSLLGLQSCAALRAAQLRVCAAIARCCFRCQCFTVQSRTVLCGSAASSWASLARAAAMPQACCRLAVMLVLYALLATQAALSACSALVKRMSKACMLPISTESWCTTAASAYHSCGSPLESDLPQLRVHYCYA